MTNKKSKRQKKYRAGKFIEEVVTALERTIVPNARVEHDVRLYDYHANQYRQCDVVIYQGEPPRETITIVEVQDRPNRKIGIGDYYSWRKKREELKVQHLICVSRKGFTKSVEESARKEGNLVRLITLKELEQSAWPIKFKEDKLDLYWGARRLVSATLNFTGNSKIPTGELIGLKPEDVTCNGEPLSFRSLFKDEYISVPQLEGEHEVFHRINFSNADNVVVAWKGEQARVVSVVGRFIVKVRLITFSLTTLAYTQIEHSGTLGWAVTGIGKVEGEDGEATLRMVYLPSEDGLYKVDTEIYGPFLIDGPIEGISFRLNSD